MVWLLDGSPEVGVARDSRRHAVRASAEPLPVDADLREDVNRLNVWYVEQQRKELTEEDASPTHLIWQDIVNRLDTVEVDVGDMKRRLTGNNTYEWDEHVISSAADVKQILGPDLGDAPLGWFVDVMTVVCQFDESFRQGLVGHRRFC